MNNISISFTRTDQLCVFGYHKYTHIFWSTDKLGIYHVYVKYRRFYRDVLPML